MIGAGVAGYALTPILGLHIGDWRVVQWGLPALAIVSGAVFFERAGKVPYLRTPHLVGDASYSLYLVHGFAVSVVFRLLGALGLPPAVEIVAAVVTGLVGGVAAYLLLERPLLRLVKYRGGRKAVARTSGLAAAPAAVTQRSSGAVG